MSRERIHILLVEDNSADVYLFQKALETAELDFELTVIGDGAEALSFIQGEGKYAGSALPDLAVVDLNLPKNDGIQILRAIRQNERFANVPVVVTSSSPSPPLQLKSEQLNVSRYIQKPPDLEDFLQIGVVLRDLLLQSKARPSSPHTET
jgi:CheY-like chemotaxis protein